MTNAEMLLQAIQAKRCLSGSYEDFPREFCPHLLGWKGRTQMVLVYQFGGSSKSGLSPDRPWRCLRVDELEDLATMDVEWKTGYAGTNMPNCVDANAVDAVAEGYSPGGRF